MTTSVITHGFRLRFFIHGALIGTGEALLELQLCDGKFVVVRASDTGRPLNEANDVQIRGTGFASADEARRCAERLRTGIRRSGVELRTGFDLGKDVATASSATVIKEQARLGGIELLDDVHGISVFAENLEVRVLRMTARGSSTCAPDRVLSAWQKQYEADVVLTDHETLALELYAAAHREPFLRARFLTLVSAVEVLAKPADRSEAARALVERMGQEIRSSSLADDEKALLVQQISHLKKESIRSACRSCVRPALGADSWRVFDRLYNLRSQLVHDGEVPNGVDLGRETAALDDIVARLLARLGERVEVSSPG